MTNTNTNTNNAHDMQQAVALWNEADATKGSADAVALVALISIADEAYSVQVGDRQVAVSISDIVNNADAKTRAAARNGFFVAFGGFEPGQEIPGACLAGLNRVIRPALLLASCGIHPVLRPIKADGREMLALSGLPFHMCADYPLHDTDGHATPDFVALVEREIEFRAEKGDAVTRDEAEGAVLNAPVILHPAFKSRGKLKPLTRLMADLSKKAVAAGLAPAPKGRAPRTSEDTGNAFTAALETVLSGMASVTGDDESGLAFTREIDVKLAKLAKLIAAYGPNVDA
jgi:hypothetical protein